MTATLPEPQTGPATPFDPVEALPEGVTVLEASAGTGKTHAVASLVVAEVARGRPLADLLVVTFTRKATGTLRQRVWEQLQSAHRVLTGDAGTPAGDALAAHLLAGRADEVAGRARRLGDALADFESATIATTHGFCQAVLGDLGVVGDVEPDAGLVEDVDDLVADAVDDLFVRRFHDGEPGAFTRDDALVVARAVIANPDAGIARVADDDPHDRLRRQFAMSVRKRIDAQKRRGRVMTYDDLLHRLDLSLRDPVRGAVAAERLRRRYGMAVVDEFQDTDPVQWRILAAAFGAAPNRLVLVGDPKQAIYAFRGGDLHTYLRATAGAHRRELTTSWRADQPLLDAVDRLLGNAALGHPDVVTRPLRARPGAEEPRLAGDAAAPVSVRVVGDDAEVERLRPGVVRKPSARHLIAEDVAAEAARLLSGGLTVFDRHGDGRPFGERPLSAGDLAVLVRTHRDAERVRDALRARQVPVVVHATTDVFDSEAARSWMALLEVLESPAAERRLRAAALGPFVGWDATRLATADDADWEQLHARIHDWATVLRQHGVARLWRRIEADTDLSARLLGRTGGERTLTDLRHVGELVDGWSVSHPSSVAVLVGWLSQQVARRADLDTDQVRQRLESDADAVSVHTIHGAKGLEFPVVLLPSAWEAPWAPDNEAPVFHDDEGRRWVGVGSRGRIHRRQCEWADEERDDEELRLLYVALTRARHRVVLWWATGADAPSSALARVLLGRDPDTGAVPRRLSGRVTTGKITDALAALDASGTSVATLDVGAAAGAAAGPTGGDHPGAVGDGGDGDGLAVARFGRGFDRHWVRTSYSGLTQAAHDAGPAPEVVVPPAPTEPVEVDEAATTDEPAVGATAAGAAEPADPAPPLPLGALPGGARFGTMVHEVLEDLDFAGPHLEAALAAAAADRGAHRLVDGAVDELVAGLAAALRTPLGPVADERRLCDLPRADRLDELAFDLPLVGGDQPTGVVTMAAIADVFARHLPPDDPLVGYHERLADPLLATSVHGFLTGSIDLVARVGGRHLVVDYKTNLLAPAGAAPTAAHYRPAALAEAMADAHYPLQAALYSVALHRYLRWRQPGYDPALHLGGVAYLFLRGMTGPDVERTEGAPGGVFSWQPPVAFVTALSELLDRGVA